MRLRVPGNPDGLLLLIDTGFNDELLLNQRAARDLGVLMLAAESDAELGDGTRITTLRGILTVSWLGLDRDVGVHVPMTAATAASTLRDDEPVGLLGTRLLAPNILEINFGIQSVIVRAEEHVPT